MRVVQLMIGVLLFGCYSPIKMSGPVLDGAAADLHDGVIVFLPKRSVLTFKLDKLTNDKGQIIDAQCEATYLDEIAILPDTNSQYRVGLRAPIIGSSDAALELSDGMLTRVSLKADTKIPETIAAVANATSKLAKFAAFHSEFPQPPGPTGVFPCNAGKRLVAIDGNKITPFEEK